MELIISASVWDGFIEQQRLDQITGEERLDQT
jgi:hypothetical protein